MKSRRRAREAVLQALYQCDTLGDFSSFSVELFFEAFGSGPVPMDKSKGALHVEQSVDDFARMMLHGICSKLPILDEKIAQSSTHWTINRMARVDRNILRLAAYEIIYLDQIPLNVTINEAVEIAKQYGGDDSPMFINGVLDNLAKHTKATKVAAQG